MLPFGLFHPQPSDCFSKLLVFLLVTLQPCVFGIEIDAATFQLPAPPFLSGHLASNNLLLESERLHDGKIVSPHSYVSYRDGVYAVTKDGLIVNIVPCEPVVVANLKPRGCSSPKECGHLISIRLNSDNLFIVLDAYRGIFEVHPLTGVSRQLYDSATEINGGASKYLNDMVLMPDGTIVVSEPSTTFDYDEEFWLRFEGRSDGRLLGFNPITAQTKVILAGLSYPTGLEITDDGQAMLVSENGRARIIKLDLRKENFFQRSYLNANLPGMPEHIRKSGKGTYWVGLTYPRFQGEMSVLDHYSSKPTSRNFLAKRRTMEQLKLMYSMRGLAVELDGGGRVVSSMHDPTGLKVKEVMEVVQTEGIVYLGTRNQNAVLRVVESADDLTVDAVVQVLRGRCKVAEDSIQAAKLSLQRQVQSRQGKRSSQSQQSSLLNTFVPQTQQYNAQVQRQGPTAQPLQQPQAVRRLQQPQLKTSGNVPAPSSQASKAAVNLRNIRQGLSQLQNKLRNAPKKNTPPAQPSPRPRTTPQQQLRPQPTPSQQLQEKYRPSPPQQQYQPQPQSSPQKQPQNLPQQQFLPPRQLPPPPQYTQPIPPQQQYRPSNPPSQQFRLPNPPPQQFLPPNPQQPQFPPPQFPSQNQQYPRPPQIPSQQQYTGPPNMQQPGSQQFGYQNQKPVLTDDPFLPPPINSGPRGYAPTIMPVPDTGYAPKLTESNSGSPTQPKVVHRVHNGQLISHIVMPSSAQKSTPPETEKPKQPTQEVKPKQVLPAQASPKSRPPNARQQSPQAQPQIPVNDEIAMGGFLGFLGSSALDSANKQKAKQNVTPSPDQAGHLGPEVGGQRQNHGLNSHNEPFHPGAAISVVHNQGVSDAATEHVLTLAQFVGTMNQTNSGGTAPPGNSQMEYGASNTSIQTESTKKMPETNAQGVSGKSAANIQNMQMFHPSEKDSVKAPNTAEPKRSFAITRVSILKQGLKGLSQYLQQNKPNPVTISTNHPSFPDIPNQQNAHVPHKESVASVSPPQSTAQDATASQFPVPSPFPNPTDSPNLMAKQVSSGQPTVLPNNQKTNPNQMSGPTANSNTGDNLPPSFSGAATIHPNQPQNEILNQDFPRNDQTGRFSSNQDSVPNSAPPHPAGPLNSPGIRQGLRSSPLQSRTLHQSATQHSNIMTPGDTNQQTVTETDSKVQSTPPEAQGDSGIKGYIKILQGPGQYIMIPLSQAALLKALGGAQQRNEQEPSLTSSTLQQQNLHAHPRQGVNVQSSLENLQRGHLERSNQAQPGQWQIHPSSGQYQNQAQPAQQTTGYQPPLTPQDDQLLQDQATQLRQQLQQQSLPVPQSGQSSHAQDTQERPNSNILLQRSNQPGAPHQDQTSRNHVATGATQDFSGSQSQPANNAPQQWQSPPSPPSPPPPQVQQKWQTLPSSPQPPAQQQIPQQQVTEHQNMRPQTFQLHYTLKQEAPAEEIPRQQITQEQKTPQIQDTTYLLQQETAHSQSQQTHQEGAQQEATQPFPPKPANDWSGSSGSPGVTQRFTSSLALSPMNKISDNGEFSQRQPPGTSLIDNSPVVPIHDSEAHSGLTDHEFPPLQSNHSTGTTNQHYIQTQQPRQVGQYHFTQQPNNRQQPTQVFEAVTPSVKLGSNQGPPLNVIPTQRSLAAPSASQGPSSTVQYHQAPKTQVTAQYQAMQQPSRQQQFTNPVVTSPLQSVANDQQRNVLSALGNTQDFSTPPVQQDGQYLSPQQPNVNIQSTYSQARSSVNIQQESFPSAQGTRQDFQAPSLQMNSQNRSTQQPNVNKQSSYSGTSSQSQSSGPGQQGYVQNANKNFQPSPPQGNNQQRYTQQSTYLTSPPTLGLTVPPTQQNIQHLTQQPGENDNQQPTYVNNSPQRPSATVQTGTFASSTHQRPTPTQQYSQHQAMTRTNENQYSIQPSTSSKSGSFVSARSNTQDLRLQPTQENNPNQFTQQGNPHQLPQQIPQQIRHQLTQQGSPNRFPQQFPRQATQQGNPNQFNQQVPQQVPHQPIQQGYPKQYTQQIPQQVPHQAPNQSNSNKFTQQVPHEITQQDNPNQLNQQVLRQVPHEVTQQDNPNQFNQQVPQQVPHQATQQDNPNQFNQQVPQQIPHQATQQDNPNQFNQQVPQQVPHQATQQDNPNQFNQQVPQQLPHQDTQQDNPNHFNQQVPQQVPHQATQQDNPNQFNQQVPQQIPHQATQQDNPNQFNQQVPQPVPHQATQQDNPNQFNQQVPQQIPHQATQQGNPNKFNQQVPQQIPHQATQQDNPNQFNQQVPQQIPHQATQQGNPNQFNQQVPQQIPHQATQQGNPNQFNQQVPQQIPHQATQQGYPKQYTQQIPQQVPQENPQQVPHQAPNQSNSNKFTQQVPHEITQQDNPNQFNQKGPQQVQQQAPHQISPNQLLQGQVPNQVMQQSRPSPNQFTQQTVPNQFTQEVRGTQPSPSPQMQPSSNAQSGSFVPTQNSGHGYRPSPTQQYNQGSQAMQTPSPSNVLWEERLVQQQTTNTQPKQQQLTQQTGANLDTFQQARGATSSQTRPTNVATVGNTSGPQPTSITPAQGSTSMGQRP